MKYEITLKNTKWFCPQCGKKGEIPESADAMMTLRAQVKKVHGNSQKCRFDWNKILVSMSPEEIAFEQRIDTLHLSKKDDYLGYCTTLQSKDGLAWMADSPKRESLILEMLKKKPMATYAIHRAFGRYGDYGDIQSLISANKLILEQHGSIKVVSLASLVKEESKT